MNIDRLRILARQAVVLARTPVTASDVFAAIEHLGKPGDPVTMSRVKDALADLVRADAIRFRPLPGGGGNGEYAKPGATFYIRPYDAPYRGTYIACDAKTGAQISPQFTDEYKVERWMRDNRPYDRKAR